MEKIYLLGDSITEWNIIRHTDILNFGKSGWTTKDLLDNFPQLEKGNLTFLMIGVNDLNNNLNFNEIIENFKIIKDKLANMNLKVFSILPSRDKALSEKINKLNYELEKMFPHFIDINSSFLENECLSNKFSIDNLHLNGEGYVLLNGFLAKEIYKYRKPQGIRDRFLEYTKWYTTSNSKSNTFPSTLEQRWFARYLEEEMKTIGLKNVEIDENGYLIGTLEKTSEAKNIPTIAFISHMDTAPDYNGAHCKAKVIENYDGKDIKLNDETILSPKDFPSLLKYEGQTLITTDGTSLLGADDKAGIAEIITAMEHLINNPHIEHGTVKVAFTPDEEIGRGADYFNVEKLGASYAYTLDGGEIGELEYENFNASSLTLKVTGRSVHPGSAKNAMIHASQLVFEFNSMLPVNERPEYTEGYEGFFMVTDVKGSIEDAEISYIIRDHSLEKFNEKKELAKNIVAFLEKKYPNAKFKLTMEDSYFNMKEKVEPHMFLVDLPKKIMENLGIKPLVKPIRGGTDGSRLSYMGLPCPNIFTGGHNFHGKYEYISLDSMKKAVEVIVEIANKISE